MHPIRFFSFGLSECLCCDDQGTLPLRKNLAGNWEGFFFFPPPANRWHGLYLTLYLNPPLSKGYKPTREILKIANRNRACVRFFGIFFTVRKGTMENWLLLLLYSLSLLILFQVTLSAQLTFCLPVFPFNTFCFISYSCCVLFNIQVNGNHTWLHKHPGKEPLISCP